MNERKKEHSARRRGVTLIEVLITVAIMTILAAAAAFSAIGIHSYQQKKVARLSASTMRRAASSWRLYHTDEACPTPARLRAERIIDLESSLTDPWGSAYVITCTEEDVSVLSPGPDRRVGTDDDIVAPPEAAVAKAP